MPRQGPTACKPVPRLFCATLVARDPKGVVHAGYAAKGLPTVVVLDAAGKVQKWQRGVGSKLKLK